jgi:putative spermidine/putrescine transport system substrate-binding protein
MSKIIRRLSALALSAALLAIPASGQAQGRDPAKITFFIWAGSNQGVVPTEVIKAYREANPRVEIEVLESNNTITYPKMVAARRTTPDKPLVHCGFFNVDSMTKGDVDGMWDQLNPERIPNLANVLKDHIRKDRRGVGYMMSAIGILYNKNNVKEPPTSWSALWSPENRGKVTMFDYDTRMMAIAARLNGGDEHNVDPGFKVWSDNAKNLRALVDSNDAVKNLVSSGDAAMAPWFSAISKIWIEEGAPLGFVVPKEGAIAFPLYLAIVDGVTPAQRAVCEDLLNTLLSPDNAGRYGTLTKSVPLVTNAKLSAEQAADPTLNLEVAKNAINLDYSYIGEMTSEWRERWDRQVKFKLR